MKKQVVGQKRLTQFFSLKSAKGSQSPPDETKETVVDLTDDGGTGKKDSVAGKLLAEGTIPKEDTLASTKSKLSLKTVSSKKKKKESCPQKDVEKTDSTKPSSGHPVLSEKVDNQNKNKKESPTKSKTPRKKKVVTSPSKVEPLKVLETVGKGTGIGSCSDVRLPASEDVDRNDGFFSAEENLPQVASVVRKRKFVGSPLKEKQNDGRLPNNPTSSSKGNGESRPSGEDVDWGDEADFGELCPDITPPKRDQPKRHKPDQLQASLSSRPSAAPSSMLEHNLSAYFQKDVVIDDKSTIRFDKLERYEVVEVVEKSNETKLTVKRPSDGVTGVCYVSSPWTDCKTRRGEMVGVRGVESGDGRWEVGWSGLLVTQPDRLISGTSVVGAVWCMRKAVLSTLFRESPAPTSTPPSHGKDIMLIGSLVHQLFQEALTMKLHSMDQIEELFQKKIKTREFMLELFLRDVNYEETVDAIRPFLKQIHSFMQQYVFSDSTQNNGENWNGQITAVEDIEENIWSPVLGVKGKVDATVEVKIHKKTKVMPLELKTGRSSFSIEHRGQVILYCMLLQQLGVRVDSGLLLYLNSAGVDMKEIRCEERETRDLTLLRNGLAHWLDRLTPSLEEWQGGGTTASLLPPPALPAPVNRRTCATCPYLISCSAHLSLGEVSRLGESHHLKELAPASISHLKRSDIDFVFHWLALLSLEKSASSVKLSDIWSVSPDLREKTGKCLRGLRMTECRRAEEDKGWLAVLCRADSSPLVSEFTTGQLLVLSTDSHLAACLATVLSISSNSITLLLEKQFKTSRPISLDAYEGDSTFGLLTQNLSCLFENNPRAATIRSLVIDRKLPTFVPKLSSKIMKVGSDIFRRLNKEQTRAVLQAMAAENYILIKGMPGTGKTTTMAALIELLTRLKKRVLVTSFTHSAIDNILLNLVDKVKMLRLGGEHRIHPKLGHVSEHHLLKSLVDPTPTAVQEIFSTKEVVGVTCYGCKHPWLERQVFDVCLVDEASQTSLPAVIKPITLAEKFVLIGDPDQLPPLVLNDTARELGLGRSLFEMLERPAVTSPLTLQYRMNSVITALANHLTYRGQLQPASDLIASATITLPNGAPENVPRWLKEALSCELAKSVIVLDLRVDISTEGGENKLEAKTVTKIIEALVKSGVESESIGVISTYTKQVALLRSLLVERSAIEVNTVDQYQGRDKEIIIYSTVRSSVSPQKKDILSDWNRLTVGITRAKKKLIILGNLSVLNSYENFNKLISFIPKENIVIVDQV